MADMFAIRNEGFSDFRRDLRKLALQKDLQKLNKAAAEIPAEKAREFGRKPFGNLAGGTSRLGSRGVAAIRATATQTRAYVTSGKKSVPWSGGADFGSGGRYRQFGPKIAEGRFVYPAIAETGPKIVEVYVDGLDNLIKPAFPKGHL